MTTDIYNRTRLTAVIGKWTDRIGLCRCNRVVVLPAVVTGGQCSCHRDFCLRGLSQGNADGVTQTILEECTNPHRRFDPPVFAFPRFRDAEVERIGPYT